MARAGEWAVTGKINPEFDEPSGVLTPEDLTPGADDGRTLYLVADTPTRIDHLLPGVKPIARIAAFNSLYLREHVVRRPDGFRPEGYTFTVARLP